MVSRAKRAKELFDDAVDLPRSDRETFLTEHCAEDSALRREVQALLEAHDHMDGFLDRTEEFPATEAPGTTIGRYKLLERVGEGGFGVVYRAEQREPVRRKVALKIIKLGMDTRQVVARFEAERQALALMDHPHIAKVLDGGATDTGRPYFVMEFVSGVPITEYCDTAGLGTRERLKLFLAVCRAVQHAHHKSVIHRDLKPSNILVAMHDGVPEPKIIDFGIAKATGQELTQKTLFTEFRQMIGTPEYMAPEQAEMSSLDVDTRADVYSLGVILYELLTGTVPFDLKVARQEGYLEMVRQIREVEPPKPSTRLSAMGDQLIAVARMRRTEPKKLGRILQGDLDWIVMKALEKNRTRRYSTANALAEDIQRSLDNLPIEAGRPSAIYRFGKFLRRYKVAATAGFAVFAALAAGIVGVWLALQRAQASEAAALASEADAIRQAERTAAVLSLTRDMLDSASPHSHRGADFTVRELLDEFDRGLEQRLSGQPDIEADIRSTVGSAYRSLGLLDKADPHLRAAVAIRRELGDERLDESLGAMGWLHHDRGDFEEAEGLLKEALDGARQRGAVPRVVARRLSMLADVESHLGRRRQATDHIDEALGLLRGIPEEERGDMLGYALDIAGLLASREERYEDAVRIQREALIERRRTHPVDDAWVATGLNNLALALVDWGKYGEAADLYREALALRLHFDGETHREVARLRARLGMALSNHEGSKKAEETLRLALRELRGVAGDERDSIARCLHDLGLQLRRTRDFAEAEEVLREAVQIRRALYGDHKVTASSLGALALVLGDRRKTDEAIAVGRESLELERRLAGPRSSGVAQGHYNLGSALLRSGQPDAAVAEFRVALDIFTDQLSPTHPTIAIIRAGIGLGLRNQRKFAEAADVYREGIELQRRLPEATTLLAELLERLSWVLLAMGQPAEAESKVREAIEIRAELQPDGWQRWYATGILGRCLSSQGQFSAAAEALDAAAEHLDRLSRTRKREIIQWSASLYEKWNEAEPTEERAARAREWRARADQ